MANRDQLLNDPEASFRAALDGRQAQIWTAMPGYVTAIDFSTMTVSVQPTIKGTVIDEDENEQPVNLPLLINVPIQFPMAGGFALTLPIAVNDECLVVFSSRCIDAWWQSGGIQKAMEARMHDLSDGFAIMGIKSVPNVLPNISTTEAQLRKTDGSTYLSITADNKIKMVAPAGIEVTGNMTVLGLLKSGLTTPTLVGASTHTHTSASPGSQTTVPTPGT